MPSYLSRALRRASESLDNLERRVRRRVARFAADAPTMRKPAQAVRSRSLDDSTTHPGHGATPSVIRDVFAQAEAGYPQQQCDLFEDFLAFDTHLRGAVDTRIDAVAGKQWLLQAGGPTDAETRAAKTLEAALRGISVGEGRSSIRETFEHLLEANHYGYANVETARDLVDGTIVPVALFTVAHRRFEWDGKTPRIKLDGGRTEPLNPGMWITSCRRGRLPAAAGILRPACWWSSFKRLSMRDWLIFAERFGSPYVTGKHDIAADDDEIAALEDAVMSLGKDGAAVFSKACDIVLTESQGGSVDVYSKIVALCDAQISKLISGATLLSESGGSASYAIGKVHQARGFDITSADANRLATAFEEGICAPFMRWNGIPGRPPVLRINIVPETDPETRMGLFVSAANDLGMTVDETQVRQEFGMTAPAPGAPVLTGKKVAAPTPPQPDPDAASEDDEPSEGPVDQPE